MPTVLELDDSRSVDILKKVNKRFLAIFILLVLPTLMTFNASLTLLLLIFPVFLIISVLFFQKQRSILKTLLFFFILYAILIPIVANFLFFTPDESPIREIIGPRESYAGFSLTFDYLFATWWIPVLIVLFVRQFRDLSGRPRKLNVANKNSRTIGNKSGTIPLGLKVGIYAQIVVFGLVSVFPMWLFIPPLLFVLFLNSSKTMMYIQGSIVILNILYLIFFTISTLNDAQTDAGGFAGVGLLIAWPILLSYIAVSSYMFVQIKKSVDQSNMEAGR